MIPTDKKRRGGVSLFNQLSAEQREQLAIWLTVENKTYAQARELCGAEFSVLPSLDALRRFYSSFAVPWQYAQAREEAETFGSLMEGNFDPATIKRAKQLAFAALTDRNPDVKTAKALLKIVGDSAKQTLAEKKVGLEERKVTLLEAKAKQAEAAKEVTENPALTPAEKEAKMRAIFGIV